MRKQIRPESNTVIKHIKHFLQKKIGSGFTWDRRAQLDNNALSTIIGEANIVLNYDSNRAVRVDRSIPLAKRLLEPDLDDDDSLEFNYVQSLKNVAPLQEMSER